jgi:hypothetical protein
MSSPPSTSRITEGALVKVEKERRYDGPDSEGGIGVVISAQANSKGAWNVKYTTDNKKEWVLPNRMTNRHVDQIETVRNRVAVLTVAAPSPPEVSVFEKFGRSGNKALIELVQKGRKKSAGWLRQLRWGKGDMPNQLSPNEQVTFALEVAALGSNAEVSQRELNEAWGMSDGYGVKLLRELHSTGDSGRKERSDANKSILMDEEYRETHVTPLSVFKKNALTGDVTTGTGRKFDTQTLRDEFAALPPEQLEELQQQVKEEKNNIANARKEIDDLLICTQGEISYESIRRNIKASVSVNTVREYVMGLEGFSYVKTGLQPWLSEAHRIKMVLWARQFWVFWHSSAIMKLKVMLVHNDEKVSLSEKLRQAKYVFLY